jgi:cysteinyl-tRNA synthetase
LQGENTATDGKLDGVLQLLIEIRKAAKSKKDFVTSDKIRQELAQLGVLLKDEKDGGVSYQFE